MNGEHGMSGEIETIEDFRRREPNLVLAKKLKLGVWVLTVLIFALVGVMGRVTLPLPEGVDLTFLPMVNAIFNTGAALSLLGALFAIKAGKVLLHRKFIGMAFLLSALFLLSYVAYHFTSGETKFGDLDGNGLLSDAERLKAGGLRGIYLLVLLSHIALASLSLPFILMTFVYAATNQFLKHRKFARWVFPVWLYVTVTGPVCYLLLRPYY
jgi:putative membrane protein